ncbi:MAG: NPCBM/NEW2 domain-containing protein [Candidatus Sumerlaeaceae bacterium]
MPGPFREAIRNTLTLVAVLFCGTTATAQVEPAAGDSITTMVRLEELDLSEMEIGWGEVHAKKSVRGNPIRLAGTTYEHGVGTHAFSKFDVNLYRSAKRFTATVGVDDECTTEGTVIFQVLVDGKKLADSGVMKGGRPPKHLEVNLTGSETMRLLVHDAEGKIHKDHADWADAIIYLADKATTRPEAGVTPPSPPADIARPTASDIPRINGPDIVGTTPGRPFLFMVPAMGKGTLSYSATGLPAALAIHPITGIITGTVKSEGVTTASVNVTGARGSASRDLTIVAGQRKLALTPPLGWNSWNVWGLSVDDAKVRAAADAMVSSGLAAHGFSYINIDDGWEGPDREPDGRIKPNDKFPDMKALSDYVHSKGLKLGIYSSPGRKTCGGYLGSYEHEQQDAQSYADWGIDYLKFDWCSYSEIVGKERNLEDYQKPYIVMRSALDAVPRDIVYSLCQYGMGGVWHWGGSPEVGGNLWRTTGDIRDRWSSILRLGFTETERNDAVGPGKWNDPDMLVVGLVGWGPKLHASKLTQQEQLTHVTLWSLVASPLLIGCDMTKLDEFTLAMLTNDEVLAVDQDRLGRPAKRRSQNGETQVWSRPLADDSIAVGLFNLDDITGGVVAQWEDLGIKGPQDARDLWLQKDIGRRDNRFESDVPGHGCRLIKLTPARAHSK